MNTATEMLASHAFVSPQEQHTTAAAASFYPVSFDSHPSLPHSYPTQAHHTTPPYMAYGMVPSDMATTAAVPAVPQPALPPVSKLLPPNTLHPPHHLVESHSNPYTVHGEPFRPSAPYYQTVPSPMVIRTPQPQRLNPPTSYHLASHNVWPETIQPSFPSVHTMPSVMAQPTAFSSPYSLFPPLEPHLPSPPPSVVDGSDHSPRKVFSFVSLPGAQQRKRPRRKYHEIERLYRCNYKDCDKSYGTLNHLNAHVCMQQHGPKRDPSEFKELRKLWRNKKREQAQEKANKACSTVVSSGSLHDPSTDRNTI